METTTWEENKIKIHRTQKMLWENTDSYNDSDRIVGPRYELNGFLSIRKQEELLLACNPIRCNLTVQRDSDQLRRYSLHQILVYHENATDEIYFSLAITYRMNIFGFYIPHPMVRHAIFLLCEIWLLIAIPFIWSATINHVGDFDGITAMYWFLAAGIFWAFVYTLIVFIDKYI